MDEKKKGKADKAAEKAARPASAKASAAKSAPVARAAKKKAEPRVESARTAKKASRETPGVVATAVLRHVRISPRKARLVVNLIKGQQVDSALRILQHSPKKASGFTERLLRSAIANAKERAGVDVDTLWVLGGKVDMGRTLDRWMSAAHGRAAPVRKRSSHITIYLGAQS